MDANQVKKSVVESYGLLAKLKKSGGISKLFSCCGPSETTSEIAEKIGYSKTDIADAPEDANLGIGCGNPAALTKIEKGETVIDLGSGAGFDAFIVSKNVGDSGKIIGVDLSDDMLTLARKNAKNGNYSNVSFVKGDIEQLPIEDSTADHIISNCVINLSTNKRQVFNEAYRVLKKGGKLAISDIVLEKELPTAIKESLMGYIACVSGAEKLDDYLQYIEAAGFKDINIIRKTHFPLELMLSDPMLIKAAKQMNLDLSSDTAADLASRVVSISFSAVK